MLKLIILIILWLNYVFFFFFFFFFMNMLLLNLLYWLLIFKVFLKIFDLLLKFLYFFLLFCTLFYNLVIFLQQNLNNFLLVLHILFVSFPGFFLSGNQAFKKIFNTKNERVPFDLADFDGRYAESTLVMVFGFCFKSPWLNTIFAHVMMVFTDFHRIFIWRVEFVIANKTLEELVSVNEISDGRLENLVHLQVQLNNFIILSTKIKR